MQRHIINRNIANYIQMHIVYVINIRLYAKTYSIVKSKKHKQKLHRNFYLCSMSIYYRLTFSQ